MRRVFYIARLELAEQTIELIHMIPFSMMFYTSVFICYWIRDTPALRSHAVLTDVIDMTVLQDMSSALCIYIYINPYIYVYTYV